MNSCEERAARGTVKAPHSVSVHRLRRASHAEEFAAAGTLTAAKQRSISQPDDQKPRFSRESIEHLDVAGARRARPPIAPFPNDDEAHRILTNA
jgi:hypothetical protein